MRVFIVQHAEKDRAGGDPDLTHTGRAEAKSVAAFFGERGTLTAVYTSPRRRAFETAAPIAHESGVPVHVDDRLRERMNWTTEQWPVFDDFLDEWQRATSDRGYEPRSGDSSMNTGNRMVAFLTDIQLSSPGDELVAVSHGGATVDLLRTLIGDTHLSQITPGVIQAGVSPAGITTLEWTGKAWEVGGVGEVGHLKKS